MSQIDLAKPQEHRAIHERDSASILAAQLGGSSAIKNFWIDVITVTPFFPYFSRGRAKPEFRLQFSPKPVNEPVFLD